MKRPQFSLRDLIWLVLLCALGAGWAADRVRLLRIEEETYHEMNERIIETNKSVNSATQDAAFWREQLLDYERERRITPHSSD